MGDPRHDLGIAAEEAAARWLEAEGWRILGRRQRSRSGGEVDVVALDPAGVLVAIEVRARRTGRAGSGSETINARRTARTGRTLADFAAGSGIAHAGLRIDLVTVAPLPGPVGRWRLRRIPDIGA
ncbi:MAG TPA: YraN family protein [Candidatus Limnocylindria bacterium]